MDLLHLFLVRPLVVAEFWQKLFLAVQQSLRSVDLIVVPLLESMSRDDLDAFNDSGVKRVIKPLPDIRNQATLIWFMNFAPIETLQSCSDFSMLPQAFPWSDRSSSAAVGSEAASTGIDRVK